MAEDKAQLHLTRPKDRSLEAYKTWVQGIVNRVNKDNVSTMTDSDWEKAHREFWEKADQAKS